MSSVALRPWLLLTLLVGRQRLNVRSLSFKNATRLLSLHGNGQLNIDLEED